MMGKSESVSILSPVKIRSTYGTTIVAIAQRSFVWRSIHRLLPVSLMYSQKMFLERMIVRDSLFFHYIGFAIFNKSLSTLVHTHTTHVPFVVYVANLTVLLKQTNNQTICQSRSTLNMSGVRCVVVC